MKSERGSALLTVILIVFVTVTIGAALSSFIMMNYKLRSLDNRIARAEYEAEKNIDTIYMLIQESVNDTIIRSRNDAFSEINSYIQNELTQAEVELTSGNVEWNDGKYISIQAGAIVYDNAAIDADGEVLYKDYCKTNAYSNIRSKLNTASNIKLIENNEDFGESGISTEIKLKDKTDIDTDIITIQLESYYKSEASPPIKFLVDFVISLPTIENVKSGNYNLNNLINLTNWEMQDWGYL